ncbi:hypothetical protein FX016_05040 [Cupriavidus gilardii]|uniref:hypothetical protein n=1 Tax=Cupriavidus sp. DB3 TaxID=2873259 RepID=UPI0011EE7EB9|nr:hypothetical protein [Cupriavidus sp. DB3]KAA0182232.1 hypothetical protein FX016_05040 [Cupriavidus gilardii]MCA7084188.1 hypothetical protein [Cupriavidus sp. DB3]
MKITTARLVLSAAIAGTALLSLNSVFAAPVRGSHAGDDYGYTFRAVDRFAEGARAFDVYAEGARTHDVFSEGARSRADYPAPIGE